MWPLSAEGKTSFLPKNGLSSASPAVSEPGPLSLSRVFPPADPELASGGSGQAQNEWSSKQTEPHLRPTSIWVSPTCVPQQAADAIIAFLRDRPDPAPGENCLCSGPAPNFRQRILPVLDASTSRQN